jgi:NitT/TauT family transport system substrate-binding protein
MDVDTALQNKGTDVAYTDLIRASRLQSRHVQLQAIMQCEENWKLITAREKRVKQIGQLKEKMIAIARFSATDYITDFVVHKARIKVDEIYKPQINSLPIRLSMLCNNQLDAAILPEPYASYSIKMGHRLVYAQDSMQVQLSAIVAKESALKNTLKCKNIALLIKGYNIAVDKLAHYKILGQLGKTSKIFSLPTESIGDSIFIPHYKKAKAVSSRDVAVSLNFLNERKQLSRKNAGNSLISYKFIRP